ncbi:hypothetical protein ACE6H2_022957 [Prunus campanulata]
MLCFTATIDNIRQRLENRNDILTLLSKTPFWPLIETYMQKRLTKLECMKSNYDILRLIKDYDTKTRKFKSNDGHSEMKSQDVAEIFGLPNRRNKLPSTTSSTRPDSHFIKSTKVQEEDDAAEEVNEEHDDATQEENEEENDAVEEVDEEHDDAAEEENEEEDDENQEHEIKPANNEKEEEATKTDHADHEEQEENEEDDDFVITLKDWVR